MDQKSTTYRVTGMTCGGCERSVRNAVERAAPGLDITVSHETGSLTIRGDHPVKAIAAAVEGAGFDFEGPR